MNRLRARRFGAVAAAVTVATLAATPLGVWFASRAAIAAARTQGWQLEVGASGGSLVTTVRVGRIYARNAALGLDVRVDELVLAPWSEHLTLTRPAVRWDLPTGEGTPPADTLRLPLADLPRIDILQGAVELRSGGGRLRASGVDAHYHAAAETSAAGRLDVSVAAWQMGDATASAGQARAALTLERTSVAVDDLWLRFDGGQRGAVTVRGHGGLDLAPARRLRADLVIEGEAPSLTAGWLDVALAGTLEPLELRVQAEGGGTQPALGPLTGQLRGRLDSAAAHVDSSHLAVAGGQIGAVGEYRFGDGTLVGELRVRAVRLEPLGLGALGGAVDGHLALRGAASAPEATLSLRCGALGGLAPDSVDLALDGTLDRVGALHLEARSGRLGRLEADGPVDLAHGRYDLELRGQLQGRPWLGRPLRAAATGRLRPDTLDFDLRSQRLPFGDEPPGPVRARGTLHGYRDLDVELNVGADVVAVRLQTDLEAGRVDGLTAQAHALDLAGLSAALGGRVSGTARAAGDLGGRVRGEAGLEVDDLSLAGWSLGPVVLATRVDSGAARVVATASGLRLEGRVDGAGAATVQGRFQDALLWRPTATPGPADSVRLSGALTARFDLGDVGAGHLAVALDSASARLSGWPLRLRGATRLEYGEGRGTLAASQVETPLGRLRLRGAATATTLEALASIDTLTSIDASGISARGRAELRVGGTPAAPRAHLALDLTELELGGRPLGALAATLELSDSLRGRVDLRSSPAAEPSLQIALAAPAAALIAGDTATAALAHVRVAADHLDATSLATWALADSTSMVLDLGADLWLPARQLVDGIQWRDVTGSLQLEALTIDRGRVRFRLAAPAAADLDRGAASLTGFELPVEVFRRDSGAWEPAGVVSVDGRLGADGAGVQARVRDLDLAGASLAIPGRPPLPAGTASGSVSFAGTMDAPVLTAAVDADLEVLGRLRARAFGRPGGWQASAVWTTPVEDSLVVTATAPAAPVWPEWRQARLEAHSSGIDLFVLLDQVPELQHLAGRVRVDVAVDSLASRPRIEGQVEVEGFELGFLDVSPGYRIPSGRLVFTPRAGGGSRGELVGLSGETTRGRGRIELTGHVDVFRLDRVEHDLHLLASDVPYRYEDTFDAPAVDLDLSWRGEPTGSVLEGRVHLTRPVADIQLVELTEPPVPPPPASQNAILESLRLAVDVDVDGLQMRSELSDMTLEGRVRAYGSFYKPRFQGELEVTRGTVIVLNRQFTFSRGRVVLERLLPTYSILDLIYDPALLEPELDLEAVARVKANDEQEEREVTLVIDGPMLSTAPRLTSPGLDNLQTLSLLALGSTNSTNFDYSGALYTAAGQLLLSRQVHKVGLDEFLLLPSGTSLGRVEETAVRVGKHFSRPLPLWVRYEAITREPSFGQFEVEYRIAKWLTLDATAHSQYELYGLGVGVSKDF